MHPLPFIVFEDGKYVLNNAASEWLSSRQAPFAVLSCAGKFRTGKSFMLNRFLKTDPNKGFGVGETVRACTRGIWLHPSFVEEEGGRTDVLVLDTEGIDALDAECEHDVRIVALAVLLSSVFVYNSTSHLDEAAVQTLSLMTRVADSLDGQHHPTLYWTLRDFSLQLVNAHGKSLTHKQYLEEALEDPPLSKCATRKAIKTLFPNRHLVTLPRPHKGESAQKLDGKGSSARNPKFDTHMDTFRTHVCTHAEPVSAAGVPLSGAVYVEHVRGVLAKINETGSIPKLEDAWTLLAKVQHADAEATSRTALLTVAERECPVDAEEGVAEWVRRQCAAHCASLRFVPPAPDASQVQARLEEDLMRHCRALGRIKDVIALCQEAAIRAVEDFAEGGFGSDATTLLTTLPEHLPPHVFKSKVLDGLLARMDAMRSVFLRIGEERCTAASTLRIEAQKMEVEHLQAQLTEVCAEKERWYEEQKTRSDAWTCTDADFELAARSPHSSDGEDEATDRTERQHARERDEQRFLVELESSLSASDERARVAEERVEQSIRRETRMQESFQASMDTLREESVATIQQYKDERDAALADSTAYKSQKLALNQECDKLRTLAREAQEHSIEMHRTTLEEIRRRDSQSRELSDAQRREWLELNRRADSSSNEVQTLKRRVDELAHLEKDVKRMRGTAAQIEIERAREEAERNHLKEQVKLERAECESLRRIRYELESRMAVLEASTKLESCKRALT